MTDRSVASSPDGPDERSGTSKAQRSRIGGSLAVGIVLALAANTGFAEDRSDPDTVRGPRWGGDWKPPPSRTGGWDWIMTTSGEWLKGEITLMRDFDLDFDSDEFDELQLDWEDVAAIQTERVHTLVLEDMRTSYVGTLSMHDGLVSVDVGDRIVTFDRKQLIAITPSSEREINLWSLRVSIGLGFRSGNTNESDLSGQVKLTREGRVTRFGFEYNGDYGSLDHVKNTNTHRGRTHFDYFLTPDFFLTPGAFEAFTDEFQNISYRLTPTLGLGYYPVRRPAFEWQLRLGTGYQYTRIDSAQPGDSKDIDAGAVVFETTLDTDLTSRIDLILDYQLQLIAPDTGLSNHHAEATLEIDLTRDIDLDLNFVWDRIEDPQTESSGRTPDANDYRSTIGLAVEF